MKFLCGRRRKKLSISKILLPPPHLTFDLHIIAKWGGDISAHFFLQGPNNNLIFVNSHKKAVEL